MQIKSILWASGALSAILLGAFITGCGGGSDRSPLQPGGGSGGNSGPSTINNFTVAPNRAAPGALVTLRGVRLNDSDEVTIKFGDNETLVHARGNDSQVYVPPFLDASNRVATPAAPLAVTVSINGGAPKAAAGTFTVLPLPAAPNAARALATQMTDTATALDNLSTNLLTPLAQQGALAPTVAAHGVALATGMSYLSGGAGNPNSVAAILSGTAPVLEGKPLPKELLDSMLAQADAGRDMEQFGDGLLALVREVAPQALQSSGTQARLKSGSQNLFIPPEGDASSLRKLSKADYKILPNAIKIIVAIRFQRFLASYGEGLGSADKLFNDTNDKIVEVLGQVADKVKGGVVGGGARVITTLYTSAKISGKIALGFAGFMPNGISEFYVRLGGTKRGNGDPVYQMRKGQTVPLNFYVVTKWGGRTIVSEDDVKDKFGALIKKAGLQKIFDKYKFSEAEQEKIIDGIFAAAVTSINAAYRAKTGQDSPWLSASGAITAPPGKNPELKINDTESNQQRLNLVSVTTLSTNVLKIQGDAPVAPNTIRLTAIDTGCNVGIRSDIVYRDLANILGESGENNAGARPLSFVRTSINVPNADGSCPNPTPTPTIRPTPRPTSAPTPRPTSKATPFPGCGTEFDGFASPPPGSTCAGVIDCRTGECVAVH